MIVIDYAETVLPVERKNESDWRQQANIYTDARALAAELGVVLVMPDRCNREAASKLVPDAQSFQGSAEKGGIVDVGIGLCATDGEIIANVLRVFVFLNRHGPKFQHIFSRVYPAQSKIELDHLIPYEPEAEQEKTPWMGKRKKVPKELLDARE
jgi:hypothetical protein